MKTLAYVTIGLFSVSTHGAWAQTSAAPTSYPVKTVRIVVGFPPGGGVDLMARIFSQKLGESLGQPYIVETRTGAGGNIAAEYVAKAAPDGYTLLMTSTVHTINATLYSRLPFDPIKDFVPVSSVASAPDCIAVHPSLPARNLAALVAMAKANPDAISYASSGAGTVMHVGMELFKSMAGIRMLHVPYNGSGPSVVAVIGGHVPVLSTSLGSALQHARAGRLRMLAVTSAERTPLAPEFPTAAEGARLPGYEAITWLGLFAPAGSPVAVINKLNAEIGRQLQSREVRDQLAANAYDAFPNTPNGFAALITTEEQKWGKVIRESGARAD